LLNDDGGRAGWLAVLTRLEADLVAAGAAEKMPGEWARPGDLGPLPRDLAGRASRLLEAQRDGIRDLEGVQRTVGHHLAAVRAVPSAQHTDRAAYLDVLG
jgi:hypothetical protein